MNAPGRHFARCISTDDRGRDEIDRELDAATTDHLATDHPPRQRKSHEVARVLNLLESIREGGDR